MSEYSRSRQEILKIRNSREWRDRVRPHKLLLTPFCEVCASDYGRLSDAKEVDHRIPLEVGGEPFDYDNLQSLCKRCHVLKSAEEARQRHKTKNK